MKRVLKWNVPIDDERHEIGSGRVVHVDIQGANIFEDRTLQVWTEESFDNTVPDKIEVQIYGTGHPYSDEGYAVGSVLTAGGQLVWHVVTFRE